VVRIYLTGRMGLEGAGAVVDEAAIPGVQGRLALAALVLARRPVARDALASVLWPEPPERWERALNPIVSKLRTLLERVGLDSRRCLVSTPGAIELRRVQALVVDLETCLNALDAAEGALRRGDVGGAWANAAVGTAIACRSFQPGVDNDWAEERRRVLHDAHVRSLDVLADVWLARGDTAQAIPAAERLVALDPLRERSHRKLLEACIAAGDHAAAARAYERCVQTLARELGLPPSEATRAVYRAVAR
jgi:DNA-binding SARP family transcriptional activator